MLKKILLALLVVLAGFLLLVVSRPDTFHIERSAMLIAPPAVVFARLNDFHAWADWSPWEKLDPAMKKTFGGPESGPGASYAWAGNDKAGEGSMLIQTATNPSHIGIELKFLKPFAATYQAGFDLAPEGTGTKVTWSMDGRNDIASKVFGLFMNMDKEVGSDFERGLASLNEVTVKDAAVVTAHDAAEAAAQAADSMGKQ
jgi:hypothetical protein